MTQDSSLTGVPPVRWTAEFAHLRKLEGAPRNPSPRNHSLMWIVKPSGCHCTDGHLTSRVSWRINKYRRVPNPP